MDIFKDKLADLPISFDQKTAEQQAKELNLVYHLSKQYTQTAHSILPELRTELDLRQYYTLINQAIRCLRYLKDGGFQLTLEQDFQVTTELSDLLIQETHRIDIAEQYVSSLKEKLQHTDWLNEKLYLEYILLCRIPAERKDLSLNKVILKNLTKLISSLDTSLWKVLFQYFRLQLLPSSEQKVEEFKSILFVVQKHKQFHFVVMCSLINHYLDDGALIPADIWTVFSTMEIGIPKLKIWKLLLEILALIYQDINITEKLSEVKQFFDLHKEKLDGELEPIILFDNVSIKIDIPVLGYKDTKNLLLFFQSVSYLPTCYDKNSNFSVKFLPKTIATTKSLLSSLSQRCSAARFDTVVSFYKKILDLASFYQVCEAIILKGKVPEIDAESPYKELVAAWDMQLKGETIRALEIFQTLLTDKKEDNELRLVSLIHVYALYLSKISKSDSTSDNLQALIIEANNIMGQLNSLLKSSIMSDSTMWCCTKLLLTIMGKFEPFTKNAETSIETAPLVKELEEYFKYNSLLPSECKEKGVAPIKIKKALLLHLWLNYIAGWILVNDVDQKCVLSSTCFKLCKQQHLPNLRYLVGLWNLLNNTIAMNNKEVAVTRSKLEQIVNEIENPAS